MFYNRSIDDLLKEYKSSLAGLSSDEARKRLAEFGYNKIEAKKKTSLIKVFFMQFVDYLALMLVVASTLSFVLGSLIEGAVIAGIVVLNATISFFQEFKAEKAIEALQKMVPQKTTVVRNNSQQIIDVSEIVQGDILVLEEGNKIPADARLIKTNSLYTNDFALTGESEPQIKFSDIIEEKNLSVTEIDNMVFMGMSVSTGNAIALVVGTGMNTEFGKIAHLTTDLKTELSPLQVEVTHIGKIVSKLIFGLSSVIAIIGFLMHYGLLENIKFTIGIAASLVPEGLPATISLVLAIAVQRMAKKKAIIKKLSAVETMGCITAIATDKTGTLTKNEMTAKEVFFNNQSYHIKGVGYNLGGEFQQNGKKISTKELNDLDLFLKAAVLCNNAHLNRYKNKTEVIGDQTEGALIMMAEKAGIKKEDFDKKFPEKFEIAFSSERKKMSTVNKAGSQYFIFSKGAPQEIIKICNKIWLNGKEATLNKTIIKEIEDKNNEYASNAMRVLAIAYKPIGKKNNYIDKEIEKDLIFLGLVAIIDPPREEVKYAVALAKKAGIKIFMVTGDYSLTGQAIAGKIGLGENLTIVTGTELNHLSDSKILSILKNNDSAIFSRVAPEHKMRIVKLLQKLENIVAVTGDGVNDAPALKKANVGIAMGITGTDVSKEAASVVLTDDSFASIISAIKEGRIVYSNMKKFIKYVFSHNFSELFSIVLSIPLGVTALTPILIFVIDLGSDIPPSLALSLDPEEPGVMDKPPRNQKKKIFNKQMMRDMIFVGLMTGIFAVAFFTFVLVNGGWQWGTKLTTNDYLYQHATTATFAGIVLAQFFNSYYCRAPLSSIFKGFRENKKLIKANLFSLFLLLNVAYNPIFNKLFATAPLNFIDWIVILTGIIIFAIILEIYRILTKPKTISTIKNDSLSANNHA
ncbi:hypothetical protein AUK11_04440 [bacterium CG2_30_37_16]|nr:MAG: hypothetical protein AUK11_04440 [bacterium CG2_30_37_16]PIX99793.1 MAG: ATPase [bacterium (Candidatus Howlettbacteria) CG_4_10_14_3_um_filter_37_10]PJB05155.1 MAG: ATPase [bacterium (Candidatus Howlettbacteria) CG_4_9_14_3_um_filter_37_10]